MASDFGLYDSYKGTGNAWSWWHGQAYNMDPPSRDTRGLYRETLSHPNL